MRFVVLGLLAIMLLLGLGLPPPAAAVVPGHSGEPAGSNPITIQAVYPAPGGLINSQTPTIRASFSDNLTAIVPSSGDMQIDGLDITGFQGFNVSSTQISYAIPNILKLSNGNHTVTVSVNDTAGDHQSYSWGFMVNTSAVISNGGIGIDPVVLLTDIAIGAGVAGLVFVGYYAYLRRRRRFTFRRYFAINPVNRRYLILVVPLLVAFLFTLVALTWAERTPGLPFLAPEYVVVVGLFVGITAYAIDSRAELRRIRAYEAAFAQFLFEMADAMRGGLDPAKALLELSGTTANAMRKPLRIAADGIRMGRPFDFVLKAAVAPMRSALISRYATLIADASSAGGETASVVYRAAKDMDDFIKIEQERGAALSLPVAVLYIAFGVLMAVLFALLNIAPTLGTLNVSFITGGSPLAGGSASVAAVPKLSLTSLDQLFFDLMAINSIGTGVIIGAFTEGNPKYGLVHSLALLAATCVAFAIFTGLF